MQVQSDKQRGQLRMPSLVPFATELIGIREIATYPHPTASPRGYVTSLVLAHQNIAPWMTCDTINNIYCRRAKKGIYCYEIYARVTATGTEDVTPATVSLTKTDAQS